MTFKPAKREIVLDGGNVRRAIRQVYLNLKKFGYDNYSLLAIDTGGGKIAEELISFGSNFDGVYDCSTLDNSCIIPKDVKGKNILICEDITLTGKTMDTVIANLKKYSPNDIKIFSLVMRENSPIVPNFYVFETNEYTRVFFPWSSFPLRSFKMGIIRKITPSDTLKEFKCGDFRIDKFVLSDYYKDALVGSYKGYVCEDNGEIRSIVKFTEQNIAMGLTGLFVDVWATSKNHDGKGYGYSLFHLLMNTMLSHGYDFILLYALDNPRGIRIYEEAGFETIGEFKDDNYGILKKMVLVNTNKHDSEIVKLILTKD